MAALARTLVVLLVTVAAAGAGPTPSTSRRAVTDARAVWSEPATRAPAYLARVVDPTFGFPITRITGDSGAIAVPPDGRWGADSRHHYSKDQPWSADESLLWIENPTKSDGWPAGGGSPSAFLLDGRTYRVLGSARFRNWRPLDSRWHPSPRYPHIRVGITRDESSGLDSLMWVDVTPGPGDRVTQLRGWRLPFTPKLIGQGEGNVSNDGRFIALSDDRELTRIVVIDMDPPGRDAYSTGARRIGPVFEMPPCSLSAGCRIGNISISPSGRYVDVKYAGDGDYHRILEVDPATLALRAHRFPDDAPRCAESIGGRPAGPNGWILSLKHADMALDSDGEDVIVGITRCRKGTRIQGRVLGVLAKQRLRDGRVTPLTDPSRGPETDGLHVSCRNLRRPGWAYVSFDNAPAYRGRRCYDEVVAVRLDGSGAVERLAHLHSDRGRYRAQPQAVPSPDGRRVLWAGNWAHRCSPCGLVDGPESRRQRHVKAFVVDTRPGPAIRSMRPEYPSDPPPAESRGGLP